jgi:hypothetical protein
MRVRIGRRRLYRLLIGRRTAAATLAGGGRGGPHPGDFRFRIAGRLTAKGGRLLAYDHLGGRVLQYSGWGPSAAALKEIRENIIIIVSYSYISL